jgi:translation elongation factor EF-Tu-like GTPase
LSIKDPFFIDSDDNYTGRLETKSTKLDTKYEAIALRIRLDQNKVSWPMIMAKTDYMSESRTQDITTLIFRPIVTKNNTTTEENQIGIDDTKIATSSFDMYNKLLDQTHSGVSAKNLGLNRKLFRARATIVLPKQKWQNTLLSKLKQKPNT